MNPKITVTPSLTKILTKSNESKLQDYKIRRDYHESSTSLTLYFYLKNPIPKSFKFDLKNNCLTLKLCFDLGLRQTCITQNFHSSIAIQKITLSPTKIEILITKSIQSSCNLQNFEQNTTKTHKKHSNNIDDLYGYEYEDLPTLINNNKTNTWDAENYVDSDDSSLAGIDDIEWIENADNMPEGQQKIIPSSEGGVVDDKVIDNMKRLKVELEKSHNKKN